MLLFISATLLGLGAPRVLILSCVDLISHDVCVIQKAVCEPMLY